LPGYGGWGNIRLFSASVEKRKPPKEYNHSLGGFIAAFFGNPNSCLTPEG